MDQLVTVGSFVKSRVFEKLHYTFGETSRPYISFPRFPLRITESWSVLERDFCGKKISLKYREMSLQNKWWMVEIIEYTGPDSDGDSPCWVLLSLVKEDLSAPDGATPRLLVNGYVSGKPTDPSKVNLSELLKAKVEVSENRLIGIGI